LGKGLHRFFALRRKKGNIPDKRINLNNTTELRWSAWGPWEWINQLFKEKGGKKKRKKGGGDALASLGKNAPNWTGGLSRRLIIWKSGEEPFAF